MEKELTGITVEGRIVNRIVRYLKPSDSYEVVDKDNNTFYVYKNDDMDKYFLSTDKTI